MDRSQISRPIAKICTYCLYRHSSPDFCVDIDKVFEDNFCEHFVLGRCFTCKRYKTDDCLDPTGIYDWCGCDAYKEDEELKNEAGLV